MRLVFDAQSAQDAIEDSFRAEGLTVHELDVREYPEETIFLIYVEARDFHRAVRLGNKLDEIIRSQGFDGFVSVRESSRLSYVDKTSSDLSDPRIDALNNLLVARSRASEIHPSLSYVPDIAGNISIIQSQRHQLVFGRRGAGKTALLIEGKRKVEESGFDAVWVNLQVLRWEPTPRIFINILRAALEVLRSGEAFAQTSAFAADSAELAESVSRMTSSSGLTVNQARELVPDANRLFKTFCKETSSRLYMFLDDFHFVGRSDQPVLLDLLHSMTRDTDVWLKVATIKNLTRWYSPSEMLGLQTVHDADSIDLDINLVEPTRVKGFLEEVLRRFAEHVSLRSLGQVFHKRSLDRLVLASGGVPRDYLTLAASSIRIARSEQRKRVGMQDINTAAGDAAQTKIEELAEDLVGAGDLADRTNHALRVVRGFCLEDRKTSFFRVDVKDKERLETEYEALISLMDLRLIHLIDPSLSDAHAAGRRYEVFMLDLSQFSGQRLKRAIRTLDLKGGKMVRHETGQPDVVGDTPRALNTILRSGPLLDLATLSTQEP